MEEKVYYTWETDEYTQTDTTTDWFWATGIIVIISATLAVIFKNYLFSILIVLGFGCIIYLKIRKPKKITISFTNRGIKLGEDILYYQDMQSFWIELDKKTEESYNLLLAMKRNFSPLLIIKVPTEIPNEGLHESLLKHLEERQLKNGQIYELMERLGF